MIASLQYGPPMNTDIDHVVLWFIFRVIDGSIKNFKAFFRWLYVGKMF